MRKHLSMLAVLILGFASTFAQTKTVTGKVTDQGGLPVPFATIRVKGLNAGTSADIDGSFSIKVKDGAVLVISGTNITPKEVTVSGSGVLSIIVTRKESNLEEVVVTSALGIKKQAKELGYSSAKISGGDAAVANPISAINGLTGKVSGLQINTVNNGLFAPTRVTLRGNRSLTGNNQPLYVVDGAIFYNDISTLNPDDIVDYNVLKGSSASAIYGSDASNGVIIITTKHGNTKSKPVVNFSTTARLETVSYLPAYQTSFGSNGGEVYVYDYHDMSTYVPFENQSYGPLFNGATVSLGRLLVDGTVLKIPYSAVKNQKRNFFDKPVTSQNNFSYSSSDDKSSFFVSGQDLQSKGSIPGDKGRRDAFRVGGSKNYGIFSANFSLAYVYKYTDQTNTGTVYDMVMNTPAQVPLSLMKDWRTSKYASTDGFYNDYFYNPYWIIDNIRNKSTSNNLTGNVQLVLKPTDYLSFSYRLSMNNTSQKYEYQQGEADYSAFSGSNLDILFSNSAGTGFDTITSYGSKWIAANNGYKQPSYNTNTYSNFLVTSDFVASFNKTFGPNFKVTANVGTTYIDNQINSLSVNAGSIFFPVYNVSSLTGIPGIGQYFAEARKLGFFGEGQVGYKGFAFVHGSYRSDIDSRLSKSNRNIPYFDVDAALVLSDLIPALKDGKTIDYAKIRGAYSVTGNASALAGGSQYIADGAYKTSPTLYSAGGFPFNGLGGYLLNGTISNPNIKPEQVTENEVGIELGFLRDKVTLGVTAYEQKLKDGIVYASLPYSSGFTQALLNAANTDNKGLEVDIKANVLRTKNLSWSVTGTYSYNKDQVKSINGNLKSLAIGGNNGNAYAVVGQAYPVIESRDWVRDASGHVIVDAVTGNPSLDPTLKVLGNATPRDIIGISSNLSWKNFSLFITADYRGGYKIFNSLGQYMDFTGISTTTTATGRQRFVFPNSVYLQNGKYVSNTNVTVDDANYNFWPGLYRSAGANYVISAAAWKLREISLVYDIPKSIFAATKIIQKATVSLSGRNLLMIRPKTNVWTDPEFNEDTGNDVGRTSENQAPPTRIFTATLSVTF